jgi:hypothetical protein
MKQETRRKKRREMKVIGDEERKTGLEDLPV